MKYSRDAYSCPVRSQRLARCLLSLSLQSSGLSGALVRYQSCRIKSPSLRFPTTSVSNQTPPPKTNPWAPLLRFPSYQRNGRPSKMSCFPGLALVGCPCSSTVFGFYFLSIEFYWNIAMPTHYQSSRPLSRCNNRVEKF